MSCSKNSIIDRSDDLVVSNKNKITVVGCGKVGGALAATILLKGITNNLALVNDSEDFAKGLALDLKHASVFLGNPRITAGSDFSISANSRICAIAVGVRPKPGQKRRDLARDNVKLLKEVVPQLVKYSPNAILVLVTNPPDIMAWATWKISGLPHTKVISAGCLIDTSRFQYFLSEEYGVSAQDCNGWVVGEHGETCVCLWSSVNIGGVPFHQLAQECYDENGEFQSSKWKAFEVKVVKAASMIREGKDHTNWTIALSTAEICQSILRNDRKVLSVGILGQGHYMIRKEVYLSLPAIVGADGVTDVVKQTLPSAEMKKLLKSADTIMETITEIQDEV